MVQLGGGGGIDFTVQHGHARTHAHTLSLTRSLTHPRPRHRHMHKASDPNGCQASTATQSPSGQRRSGFGRPYTVGHAPAGDAPHTCMAAPPKKGVAIGYRVCLARTRPQPRPAPPFLHAQFQRWDVGWDREGHLGGGGGGVQEIGGLEETNHLGSSCAITDPTTQPKAEGGHGRGSYRTIWCPGPLALT